MSLGIEYSLFLNTSNKKNLDQLGEFGGKKIRGQKMYIELWGKKNLPSPDVSEHYNTKSKIVLFFFFDIDSRIDSVLQSFIPFLQNTK